LKFKDFMTVIHLREIKTKALRLGIREFESKNETDARRLIISREFVSLLKSRLHGQINKVLNSSRDESNRTHKFWVECLGNNHNLVKSIIKRRNWLVW
jgi:hypothetical protein